MPALAARLGAFFGGLAVLLVAVGLVVGLPLAWFGAKLMASMLYKLQAHDPLSFASAACGVILIALLAAWTPARRAAAVDPMWVIRME